MTWTVRALKWHTYKGVAYAEKTVYTVEEDTAEALEVQLNSLALQGHAHRVDPVDEADPG
jgi:hypothetical protein